jgi:serine acetyltransferase
MRSRLSKLITMEWQVNAAIALSRACYLRMPVIGRFIGMFIDRLILIFFGIDLWSFSVDVKHLSIAHPVGIMFGGVGVYSEGRVVVMSGVKFGGARPSDPLFLERSRAGRTFVLGDNVVISTGSILLGPLTICDNVVIGAMSLVNRSIDEPGVYAGCPARKISDEVTFDWVAHLPDPRLDKAG